jgi:hypothetical protein
MADELMVLTAGAKVLETMMPGASSVLERTAGLAGEQIGIGSGIARVGLNSASFAKAGEATPALAMVARSGEAGLPELGIAFSDGGAMVASQDAVRLATANGGFVNSSLDQISAEIAGGHRLEMNIVNDKLSVLADGKPVSNGDYLPAPFHAGVKIDPGRAVVDMSGGLRLSLDRFMGSTVSSESRTASGLLGPEVSASVINPRHGWSGVQVGEFNPKTYPSPPAFMWRPTGELSVRTSPQTAALAQFKPVPNLATSISDLSK